MTCMVRSEKGDDIEGTGNEKREYVKKGQRQRYTGIGGIVCIYIYVIQAGEGRQVLTGSTGWRKVRAEW